MIGKIVTGKSFKGAVEYVMNKPGAQLLACDGVNTSEIREVIRSFNFQRKARPEKEYVVGHISLSFHPDDAPRLTDDFMRQLAGEYMQRMNITDTQYIVVRHNDTEHPHIHILYNRVKYNAKLVRKHNEYIRNVAVCKAIKQKYGLTFSEGKENVKTEKLHGPDQVKYTIYGAIKEALPRCLSLAELADELGRQGIATAFVHRGGDPEKEVQGLTFTKDAITFKASQVDRKFSYSNLNKLIEAKRVQAEVQARQEKEQDRMVKEMIEERNRRIGEIDGYKLSPREQEQLYSPDGLRLRKRKNGMESTILFRSFRPESGPDILTREILSQSRINDNPVVFGVRLTDEQVREIRDGQYVYLENMVRENRPFSGYFVADDGLKQGWIYQRPPDERVRYGRFKMRIMDRDLIEQGFVVRALVEWYGIGQTVRPYLWKEKPTDTDDKESWSDPRKPKQAQTPGMKHAPAVESRQEQKTGQDDNRPKVRKGRGI